MKTAAAFSALVASSAAQFFSVMTLRSASPIHFGQLQARGNKFYINGGAPSSYCPPSLPEGTCEGLPGNSTVFAGGQDTLSLAVTVPGGQQVYIAPDGNMSYTVAHSASKPEGSVVDGWTKTQGEQYGFLEFDGGLLACPPDEEGAGWQVYGKIEGFTAPKEGCLGFSAITPNVSKTNAWQY